MSSVATGFLTGAGATATGAIAGSPIPLGLAITAADRARAAGLRAQLDRLSRRPGRRTSTPVVAALQTSLRQLELDPAQICRSLRTLVEAGHITQVPAPAGADGRGRWYRQR